MAKIAHLTSVHSPFDVRIFFKECKSLAAAGHEVVLIAPGGEDRLVEGVRIQAIAKAARRFERMTKTVWAIYRTAIREKADVYHLHDPELIPVGLLLRLRGKRVVYDVHEDVPRDILFKYYLPVRLRRFVGRAVEVVEDFAAKRFSALVCVTPHIAKRFRSFNARVVTVQNFPLLSELADDTPATSWQRREAAVAYIGTIMVSRSIREMVGALGLLPENRAAELRLAGTYSPESLRDAVIELPGWERVRELGFLDRRAVKQALNQVRAGLVLFYPEPNHVYAGPNKMFEYMAAGIPVIASDFPLWREIVEGAGCGRLVDPLDPRAIADAIEYLLSHPEEAEAMGRNGRRAVEERYNWKNEEKKLLALYKELLSKSSYSG
jgi:glycosyltransferase involved in cell wall biosynthesis